MNEKTDARVKLTTIVGVIELSGLFPGFMKFDGDGGKSKPFVMFGELKSSISSLNIMPVLTERFIAPKLQSQLMKLILKNSEPNKKLGKDLVKLFDSMTTK